MLGLLTRNTFTITERMKIQDRRIREKDYTHFGKILTIVLEASRDVRAPDEGITSRVGLTLDWLNSKNGPLVAFGGRGSHQDYQDLLLPQTISQLPDVPDPRYIRRSMQDPPAPRIPQPLEERASGKIYDRFGRPFLVFHPVHQVLIQPFGTNAFVCAEGRTNSGDGTQLTYLLDVEAMRGYFVGGLISIGMAYKKDTAASRPAAA